MVGSDGDRTDGADVDDGESDGRADPAEAFAALSDPTRVEILRALAARHREHPGERAVRFSTLRKAVGVRDSGRFRYHLEKLRDAFVRKVEREGENADGASGYRLTYAGAEVVNAIVAGTYTGRESRGPTELESDCPFCGTPAIASYDDGVLAVACEDDHPLFYWSLPPNAAEGSSLEELIDLATTLAYQSYELVVDGVCSECYSSVEPSITRRDGSEDETSRAGDGHAEPDADEGANRVGQPFRFTARCDACGSAWDGPAGFALLGHPELEALAHRRGRPIRETYWWELEFVGEAASVERLAEDPLRIRLDAPFGDGELRAEIDGDGRVASLEHGSRR